jgi:hypothetical protein
LIYKGKLIQDSDLISIIEDNDFINVVLSKKQQKSHVIRVEEEEESSSGFESLREHGFDSDDIETLRSLFSLEIQNMVENTQRLEDETESEHRSRIENAWVRSNIRHFISNSRNSSGYDRVTDSNTEFLIGFALGFILGFVMMFWIADGSSSRSRRTGILVGVAANIGWGLLKTPVEIYDPIDPYVVVGG